MAELWRNYANELMKDAGVDIRKKKLLKADFHGSIFLVSQCIQPSMVGVTGIVLQETESAFLLITKANRLKAIPKDGTVFSVALSSSDVMTLYGSHFTGRSSERTSKKFKWKSTIEL